jgi:hypothetical protein
MVDKTAIKQYSLKVLWFCLANHHSTNTPESSIICIITDWYNSKGKGKSKVVQAH